MLRHLFVLTLLFGVNLAHAIEVNVPEDWTPLDVPSEMPTSINSLTKVISPDGNAEASISEMEIVMSLDEAAVSYVRGAAKGGFQHSATTTLMVEGYESRHITGTFPFPDSESEIPVEAYIILTQDTMMSIGVTGLDSSSQIKEVLGWIQFPVVDTAPTGGKSDVATGRSLWEYLGMGIVFAAIAYVIINAKSSREKPKENKTSHSTADSA